jgi:glycosyltransferase involved in cell wall biosynthesis
MVTTFYPPFNFGGDGIAIERLARALVRQGHEVTVVHDVDTYRALHSDPEPDPPAEELVDGVRIVHLRSRLGVLSPLLVHQLGRPVLHRQRLRELLAPGRFDVVHYHNVSLVGGPGILTWETGSVTLYTAHEYWLVCPTHDLWRHKREPCTGRECFRCELSHRRPPQYWRHTGAIERGLRAVDVVIAPSETSREKHREFGLTREMVVLPNFLPAAEIPGSPGIGSRPSERPYFFFGGRLVRIKGLDDVIPVFRDLPGADLVIAGEGDHRGALERIAGGAANIRFVGKLPAREMARWYAHSEAVLVPSVCWETFGLVLLEAFAAGAPVIARRLGSPAELLEASGAGALFTTPAELRASLERFLGNAALRGELAARGRRALAERWTDDVVLPRYLELIHEAAARRGLPLEPARREPALATG